MLNRSQPPQIHGKKKFKIPHFDLQPIHKNLQLLVVKDSTAKDIRLTFMVDRGIPKNHEDYILTDILPFSLIGTTKKATKEKLQSLLMSASINLLPFTDADRLIFAINSLAPSLFLKCLPQIVEIFKTPSFKKEEVAAAKHQKELMLQMQEKMPEVVGGQRVEALLYGKNHPYSYKFQKKDLPLVTEEKLKSIFEKIAWYKGVVILTGAVEKAIVEEVKKEFKTLPQKKESSNDFPNPKPEICQKAEMILTNHPQSTLILATRTISRRHPDYYALVLLCELLGGCYIGSLLMQQIREKKGITYSISCSLLRVKHDIVISIRGSVEKGKAREVEEAIWEEIEALKAAPITKKTLNLFKKHYQGQLHAFVDNKAMFGSAIGNSYMRGEAHHFIDRYHELYAKTETITPEELQSVAKKHLHRNQFAQVIINP